VLPKSTSNSKPHFQLGGHLAAITIFKNMVNQYELILTAWQLPANKLSSNSFVEQLRLHYPHQQHWVAVDNPNTLIFLQDITQKLDSNPNPLSSALAGSELVCDFAATQLVPGKLLSPNGAGGLLMSSLNIPQEADEEFNAWCTEEHVARLSRVPGVLSARRYKTTKGVQRYVNLYHLSAPEVQASEEWKEATNTPWSTRLRPLFTDKLRIVARPLR
jgi:hypothetical protein